NLEWSKNQEVGQRGLIHQYMDNLVKILIHIKNEEKKMQSHMGILSVPPWAMDPWTNRSLKLISSSSIGQPILTLMTYMSVFLFSYKYSPHFKLAFIRIILLIHLKGRVSKLSFDTKLADMHSLPFHFQAETMGPAEVVLELHIYLDLRTKCWF
ncbi:hypothetical protein ACJX0J_025124, partial [Zea mays]